MRKTIAVAIVLSSAFLLHSALAGGGSAETKEALQALQDYIGEWKGDGTADWSWRFKGKDVWLSVALPSAKHLTGGELRFLPGKDKYQLTATDKAGKKLVFEGPLKKDRLILERTDAETKETQQLTLNTAGGGIRFVLTYATKAENRTLYNKQYQLAFTKVGETFGVVAGQKRPECVVTGGLGTSTVSYKGVTYYVCCSGCRDAFNDDPEKILKEYQARKKAGR